MAILLPKKVKHRKWHKGRRRNKRNETRGTELVFGSFGLKAMESKWINSRQIEAARRGIIRFLKKGGKLWIRIFPDKPITKKPAETRMGKGKGDPEFWVDVIRRGKILYELEGVPEDVAREAMRLAQRKFPMKTRFIKRNK